eukprot:gene8626-35918_t
MRVRLSSLRLSSLEQGRACRRDFPDADQRVVLEVTKKAGRVGCATKLTEITALASGGAAACGRAPRGIPATRAQLVRGR